MFGSSRNGAGNVILYHCHSDERGQCPFTCLADEFWKHHVHLIAHKFETKAEYEAAYLAQNKARSASL